MRNGKAQKLVAAGYTLRSKRRHQQSDGDSQRNFEEPVHCSCPRVCQGRNNLTSSQLTVWNFADTYRSGHDVKETTPAAKWSGAWPLETVRQASLRSGTRSIISSIASCRFPLKASDAIKWFVSNFRTRLIAVINFGYSSNASQRS